MQTLFFILLGFTLMVTITSGTPISSTLTSRKPTEGHSCGLDGAVDATASVCKGMLDNINTDWSQTCDWGDGNTAFYPASANGCSVYTTARDWSQQELKDAVKSVLDPCTDPARDKVNGRRVFRDGSQVCVTVSGCKNCFTDG